MKMIWCSRHAVIALASAVSLASLAACTGKSGGDSSGAPSSSAGPAATAAPSAANVSCDAVIAKFQSLGKLDADGTKLLTAMCAGQSQTVRTCIVGAKTMKDVDACDPHPFKGAAAAQTGPEVKVGDLVDLDLGAADPAWKGWVAKGPKDAKIMADGLHGARIAANGMNAYDIAFASGKTKMADKKKGIETGRKIMGPDVKITYTTDTADSLEWATEVSGSRSGTSRATSRRREGRHVLDRDHGRDDGHHARGAQGGVRQPAQEVTARRPRESVT